MNGVELVNVGKTYGNLVVIDGMNLAIPRGKFTVFVGPSGCGKSTLLRMIAGLEEITSGDLLLEGDRANEATPTERGVSMVFQNYALYPHMSVRDNIGFGLKMIGESRPERLKKINEAAELLQLSDYLDRKPAALSGGQRQRVAIGRAIVRNPRLFLFDEPLSNLDAALRQDMRVQIATLHRTLDATMIYVTHDQVEAMTLADIIVVLKDGKIEQVGAPLSLYDDPDNLFVAEFLGNPTINVMSAVVRADGEDRVAELEDKSRIRLPQNFPVATDIQIRVAVRPQNLTLGTGAEVQFTFRPEICERLGGQDIYFGRMDGGNKLAFETQARDAVELDTTVTVSAPHDALMFFDMKGDRIRIGR